MIERAGAVTFLGNPLTLLGSEQKVGDRMPDGVLADNDMKPVRLSDFKGHVVILSCVPSLDTPTCDIETRRFNQEAAGLGPDVLVLTVSRDLPFAQKRWCGAAGIDRVVTLSDYRDGSFGIAAGVMIKESALLARVVFVLDRDGVIRLIQTVSEVSKEPDYAPILEAAKRLV